MKTAKFGGTSLADAGRFLQVRDIILSDPEIRFAVVSAPGDLTDENQMWEAVTSGTKTVLRNVGTGRYLDYNYGLTSVTNVSSAENMQFSGGHIRIGTRYLELTSAHAAASSNSANASDINLTVKTDTAGRPGVGYTVTNLYGAYKLPATGGRGTEIITSGGLALLVTAAFSALMYMCNFGRKRQKGGR